MASISSAFGDDAGVLRDADFQVLLLANLIGPLGTAIMSPLLDSLVGPLGAAESTVGLLMTAYYAPAIVMIPLVGALADRYGRKPMLVAGLLVFGASGTAIALTTDFRVALALRFLQGVGFSGTVPVIITALGDLYRGPEESTAQGLRFASTGLSQAVFPAIAGVLVVIAWQYPFLLHALAFPVAAVVYRRFGEPTGGGDGSETDRMAYARDLAGLLTRPRVASILAARAVPPFLYITLLTYVSFVVVRSLGATPREAGFLVAVLSLTNALVATQAGRVAARFGGPTLPLVGANGLFVAGIATIAFAPTLPVAGAGAVILGVGLGLAFSLFRSLVTGLAPEHLRGGIVSAGESIGRLAATVAPVIVGGVVAVATPSLGFVAALRWTLVGVAAVTGAAGALGLLVGMRSTGA